MSSNQEKTFDEFLAALKKWGVSLPPDELDACFQVLTDLGQALDRLDLSLASEETVEKVRKLLEALEKIDGFLLSEAGEKIFSSDSRLFYFRSNLKTLINQLRRLDYAFILKELNLLAPELKAASAGLRQSLHTLETITAVMDVIAKFITIAGKAAGLAL